MTLSVHVLSGCRPDPLAHYLKALAVVRLVHAQADPLVRARWGSEGLELATVLSEGDLTAFFLERWAPAPLLDPWNGGSGFYPKDKAAYAEGLAPVLACPHPRFDAYRQALEREWERTRGWDQRPDGHAKTQLQADCRNTWSEAALSFLRAALTPVDDAVQYPALLGTGGNDGRLDFPANFMRRIWDVLAEDGHPRPSAQGSLRSALFGDVTPSLVTAVVGQYLPGGAGGANATDGFSGNSAVNPWDFLLMMEGTLALPVATTRAANGELAQAAAPFAFQSIAAGYGTACRTEESARGEQWFPTWSRWASWPELEALFREGRMSVSERREGTRPSRRALDAARAVRTHGAARGLEAFHRYAYVERNGQANLAVPLGTLSTSSDPHVALLDDVADWVRAFRGAIKDDGPRSAIQTLGRLEGAMWEVCRADTPARWRALVASLGEAEALVVARPRLAPQSHLRPLPRLRAAWWERMGDLPEVALAASITAAHHQGRQVLRAHVAPLEGYGFAQSDERLRHDANVVWSGRDLVSDLLAVLRRRLLTHEEGAFPMAPGTTLAPEHILTFLDGRTDDRLLASLIRGSTTIEPRPVQSLEMERLPGPYAVLRLAYWPGPIDEHGAPPTADPRPLHLLSAGRYAAGVSAAAQRLGGRGLRVTTRSAVGGPEEARRLAAALAFPLALSTRRALERSVRRHHDPDSHSAGEPS